MANYNRVILAGNLTRDPDFKQLNSGHAICNLALAINRQYKNKQTGAMVKEVTYVDIDVWGPQAESCRQYLQKGRPILVEGRLKYDTWKDANDQSKRSKLYVVADRVVFLSNSFSNDSVNDSFEIEEKVSPKNQAEKDLLDQIEEIKSRSEVVETKSSKKSQSKQLKPTDLSDEGIFKDEIEFKDEPPFQDDLPF